MNRCADQYNQVLEKYSVEITERPNPVPYNYRISFRMAELCLIVKKSTSLGGVSLSKINILSDALSLYSSLERLKEFIENDEEDYRIKYDPIVTRVIQYLIYDGLLCQQTNKKYKLTDKGKTFVKKIDEDKSLLVREKQILEVIGKKLKEDKIDQLQLMWRY